MVKRYYSKEELLNYIEREPNVTELKDKEVLLHLDSFCLGDTICFSSLILPFIEHHNPKRVIVSTFFKHLFDDEFNEKVIFIQSNIKETIIVDKLINVGYDKKNLKHTLGGMFYAAKETMLLPQTTNPETPPVKKKKRVINNKKITIAPESIKKISRWDYYGSLGWQIVVDYLVNLGYEVYNVSYEKTLDLKNTINFNGYDDINVSLSHILDSKIFIGLSSGLSWLSWAYEVPVVMISNFTKPHNEFECYRVSNPMSCSGCFNTFPGITNNCPLFIGTIRENECHKSITPEMVIEKINLALNEN
jgi:autotransporter strand-loop-strand O-heptosyltransferase